MKGVPGKKIDTFLGEILGEKKTIQKRKYFRANISVRKKRYLHAARYNYIDPM